MLMSVSISCECGTDEPSLKDGRKEGRMERGTARKEEKKTKEDAKERRKDIKEGTQETRQGTARQARQGRVGRNVPQM